jgi:hypothetical protein
MAETRCWTKDDMPRALEWVRLEAKAGLEFRAERVNLVEALQELGAITEPQNLVQALRLELTEDAWLRLSDTLRQYERQAPGPRGLPASVVGRPAPTRPALSRPAHPVPREPSSTGAREADRSVRGDLLPSTADSRGGHSPQFSRPETPVRRPR